MPLIAIFKCAYCTSFGPIKVLKAMTSQVLELSSFFNVTSKFLLLNIILAFFKIDSLLSFHQIKYYFMCVDYQLGIDQAKLIMCIGTSFSTTHLFSPYFFSLLVFFLFLSLPPLWTMSPPPPIEASLHRSLFSYDGFFLCE